MAQDTNQTSSNIPTATRVATTLISVFVIGLLIAADQITKILVKTYIPVGEEVEIIKPLLYFTHVENTGAAWSMLSGKQVFFIILTFVMMIAITIFFFILPMKKHYLPLRTCLVFLMGGAIGNLIDRISLGKVTDFIDSRLIYQITGQNYNFPIYNFADICVTLSMLVLILLIIFKYKDADFAFLKPSAKEGSSKKKGMFSGQETYVITKNSGTTNKTQTLVEEADTDTQQNKGADK